MENVTIGLALAAGLLSFISPCVLPLVPAYIGYMGGRLTHKVSQQAAYGGAASGSLFFRLQLLLHGMAFVCGFTLIFVLIGLFTTALSWLAGQHVATFTEVIGRFGGLVIIFFGFQFMGLAPRFFAWLRKKSQSSLLDNALLSLLAVALAALILYWGFLGQALPALVLSAALALFMFSRGAFTQPAVFWHALLERLDAAVYADTRGEIGAGGRDGLLGSAFMGMVFSAGWSPCIGPLLGTILTVAATSGASTGQVAQGMLLLAAYSIGLGIPFILTALLLNSAQGLLRRLQRKMNAIKLFSGSLLVVIGLLVASGQLQSLSQTFSRGDFADFTYRVEECGLGYFEGQLRLSHVGACLDGSLIPVAINQSASAQFSPGQPRQEFLFHASAPQSIDIETRGLNDDIPDFALSLYGPDDEELARGSKSESIAADGRLYPLAGFTLSEAGHYRALLSSMAPAADARFRIKIRDAQPLTPDAAPQSFASSLINSLTAIASDLQPAVGLAEGNRAPDFSIRSLDGRQINLGDLRGQVVLLNFWGTWCGPCRREMPEFQRVYAEWRERGFEILAIAYNDSEAAMADFRDEFGLSYPLALDADGAINDAYAIQTRPSSYLLDADGLILARHFGLMNEALLTTLVSQALADD